MILLRSFAEEHFPVERECGEPTEFAL